MILLASLAVVEPAIIAGCFMTLNSILTLWLSRKLAHQEKEEERRDDAREHREEDTLRQIKEEGGDAT